MTHAPREDRSRGRIEERARTLRVIVYAGIDPVTGKRVYLRETIQGTDRAAHKRAEKVLNKLLAQADKQQTATSSVKFSFALEEWMRTNEIEESTSNTYRGYINRTITPALGEQPVNKISARMLESFYSDLRRCRARCDGKPYVEHRKTEEHDCQKAKCRPHACSPMAQSTVRQIHAIISGTLDAAERWEWIDSNPARVARKPKQKRPEPTPPTPAEAARLSEEAFRIDDDWGTLVWLAMTTGMRRGELAALRFSHIDLDQEVVWVHRNWVRGKEKDTKTHQRRRIALDSETVALLREQRERVAGRVGEAGAEFREELFVFSSVETPDHTQPYSPNAMTPRYKKMATRLGIDTHLHALRHYSATELLTAGVDLPTVSGRLGHGGGGATTLRVYAAWVAASDRKAAEILGSRMPKRNKK
ncbi:tyrosine-type recombinase/integrase [Saccharopolyspora sp. TS4A08]|uniref:Tyrosine-type recombinase/integrase n=1 Tax=Saccharopolyspora ipomoeae TaxID=3042027 RepID=A0ABT6PUL1_9PSEU|nr:tyrosine-type recombinase/integrase [Saccharopolyspora sp. TS4A08]MDI2031698.1 tyrosine-type recombinase/integrase [Saccharopolyspora sp. TS4A08]